MGDIFGKYIPKFEYELVNLNDHSRDEIIKYGNALSLILLIDKIKWADEISLLSVPDAYLEHLSKNIPEHLLPLIGDCVRIFLAHIDAPEEEIERITEKIYKRRLNEMFQLVDGYSVKKTREQAKQEGKIEAKEEAMREALEEKIEIALKLIKRGLNIKDVAEDTGLSIAEIELEVKKSKRIK